MASSLKKVAIIGSGNWGSAIARLVGRNAARKIFIMVIRSTPFLEVTMVVSHSYAQQYYKFIQQFTTHQKTKIKQH